MRSVEVDLADDRFDVAYEASRVAPGRMLFAIQGLGYEPALVDGSPAEPEVTPERVDPAVLPSDLRELFARAEQEDRAVLLDFFAPG